MMSVSTKTSRGASRSPRPWLAPAVALGLILLGGYLIGGTSPHPARGERSTAVARSAPPATAPALLRTRSIEDIRVGDRVRANSPATASGTPTADVDAARSAGRAGTDRGVLPSSEPALDQEEVDPTSWRYVELVMPQEHGDVDIVLLRPIWWIEAIDAAPGRSIVLNMPEMGATGPARVVAVGPCPPLEPGSGRVITGTYTHAGAPVLDIRLEGVDEPIGATPWHPFYSLDRRRFVAAEELRAGERLRPVSGATRVVSVTRRAGTHQVYNLEVHGEHVYHVTTLGVLVHNQSSGGEKVKVYHGTDSESAAEILANKLNYKKLLKAGGNLVDDKGFSVAQDRTIAEGYAQSRASLRATPEGVVIEIEIEKSLIQPSETAVTDAGEGYIKPKHFPKANRSGVFKDVGRVPPLGQ